MAGAISCTMRWAKYRLETGCTHADMVAGAIFGNDIILFTLLLSENGDILQENFTFGDRAMRKTLSAFSCLLIIAPFLGFCLSITCLGLSAREGRETSVSLMAVEKKGNIFFPGEAIELAFSLSEADNRELAFVYTIKDFQGREVEKGKRVISSFEKGQPLNQRVKAPYLKGIYFLSASLLNNSGLLTQKEFRVGVIPRSSAERHYSSGESDFGISVISTYEKLLAPDDNYTFVDLAGIKWNRPLIFWDLVEPEQGQFNWELYDAILNERHQHGLALVPVIGILNHVPRWASSSPEKDDFKGYPPKDARDVASLVSQVVKRYECIAKYWVIDNEVNIQEKLPGWKDLDTYLECLKVSYKAAKEADPKCKIILAAVTLNDADFVRRFYQKGGKDYFDIMALHPYCTPAPPEDEEGSLFFRLALGKKRAAFPDILAVLKIMEEYGNGQKPIWITETGWVEKHEYPKENRPPWAGLIEVSEQEQADYYVRGYTLSKSYGVGKFFFNVMINFPEGLGAHSLNRGMLSADLSPKLVFVAYCQMTSLLSEARFERRIDLDDKDLHAYLFSKNGIGIVVMWRAKGEASEISLQTGDIHLTLLDIFGNQKEIKSENGILSLELTGSPQYLLAESESLSSLQVHTQ